MRSSFCLRGLILAALMAGGANAAPRISTTYEEYAINGKNGTELMREIHRKGPPHGSMARAIAQTRYSLDYGYRTLRGEGQCRVTNSWVRLDITYVFPSIPSSTPPELRERWERFMHGVRAHEKGHAEIAIRMAGAAEDFLKTHSHPEDPGCRGLKRTADAEIRRLFEAHEALQEKFDRIEHGKGGPVDRIISGLTGQNSGPQGAAGR